MGYIMVIVEWLISPAFHRYYTSLFSWIAFMHGERVWFSLLCMNLIQISSFIGFLAFWIAYHYGKWKKKTHTIPTGMCMNSFFLHFSLASAVTVVVVVFCSFHKRAKLHAGHAFNDMAKEIDWIPFLDHLMSIMLLYTFWWTSLWAYVIERKWILESGTHAMGLGNYRPMLLCLIQHMHQRITRFWIPSRVFQLEPIESNACVKY